MKKIRFAKSCSFTLFCLFLSLAFCSPYPAYSSGPTNYIFTKIADFDTAVPNGTGNFGVLGNPSLSHGKVTFIGASGSLSGIYMYDYLTNQLEVVADKNTLAPGGTDNFTGFQGVPSISSANIAFWGFRSGNREGIYAYINGQLEVIADGNTWIPDGDWYFQGFQYNPSISIDKVALSSFGVGIYTDYGGVLNTVADRNTNIPEATQSVFTVLFIFIFLSHPFA